MKKYEIYCDNCGEILSKSGDNCGKFHFKLIAVEGHGSKNSGACDVYFIQQEIIDRHFCHLKCLNGWVNNVGI